MPIGLEHSLTKGALGLHSTEMQSQRAICFSPHLYRARNLVDRFFNRIKQCRRIATRYDKLAANYRPVHVKTLRSQKLRMLLTHRKLLQSKAIAIENVLRGTIRNDREGEVRGADQGAGRELA
jgi:hypothetical protein